MQLQLMALPLQAPRYDVVSLITCTPDDRRLEALARAYRRLLGRDLVDVVRVAHVTSLAEGYNLAYKRAQGDVLIFSHHDVEVMAPDFGAKLKAYMERFDVLGVAGTTRLAGPKWLDAGPPHIFGQVLHPSPTPPGYTVAIYGAPTRSVGNIQALDGLFLAVRREVLERVSFDQDTFNGFHLYDIDFTYSAYLAGFRIGVANDLDVFHHSWGRFDSVWATYADRFVKKHGARLPSLRPRAHRWSIVDVPTMEEAIEAMRPGYWDQGAQ
jgi:GT2 family glycosyltransferase